MSSDTAYSYHITRQQQTAAICDSSSCSSRPEICRKHHWYSKQYLTYAPE